MRDTGQEKLQTAWWGLPTFFVHEAESHDHEIVTRAEQQFHIYQGADQLILCHKSIFEPDGAKIEEEIPGTSKHDSFHLKPSRRPPVHGNSTYTVVSATEQHDGKEA